MTTQRTVMVRVMTKEEFMRLPSSARPDILTFDPCRGMLMTAGCREDSLPLAGEIIPDTMLQEIMDSFYGQRHCEPRLVTPYEYIKQRQETDNQISSYVRAQELNGAHEALAALGRRNQMATQVDESVTKEGAPQTGSPLADKILRTPGGTYEEVAVAHELIEESDADGKTFHLLTPPLHLLGIGDPDPNTVLHLMKKFDIGQLAARYLCRRIMYRRRQNGAPAAGPLSAQLLRSGAVSADRITVDWPADDDEVRPDHIA